MLESIFQVFGYLLAWLLIGTGLTFIIAAAFFGVKEEKNLEENNHDL